MHGQQNIKHWIEDTAYFEIYVFEDSWGLLWKGQDGQPELTKLYSEENIIGFSKQIRKWICDQTTKSRYVVETNT